MFDKLNVYRMTNLKEEIKIQESNKGKENMKIRRAIKTITNNEKANRKNIN